MQGERQSLVFEKRSGNVIVHGMQQPSFLVRSSGRFLNNRVQLANNRFTGLLLSECCETGSNFDTYQFVFWPGSDGRGDL